MSKIQNRKQFLRWFKKTNPEFYKAVALNVKGANQLGAETVTAEPSTWDKIVSGITDLVPTYLQYDQQRKLMDMQLQRAERGLPPLEASQLAPTVKIGVGAGLQKMLLPALLIGGGLLAFNVLRR